MSDRYLLFLAIILLGYSIFGKTFAKIGFPPLYIGELALLAGLYSIAKSNAIQNITKLKVNYVFIAFFLVGISCTLPYITRYKVDALRDAAVWGYGLFAIILFCKIYERPSTLEYYIELYSKFVFIFLIITPVVWLIVQLFYGGVSKLPSAGQKQLFYMKTPDVMVHLSGITAFFVTGFARFNKFYAVLLVLNIMLCAYSTRAGMLTFMTSFGVLIIFNRDNIIVKRMVKIIILSLFLFWASGISIKTERREISFTQLKNNLVSAFTTSSDESLDGTKLWRLLWWNEILNYTFFGEHFWQGKGFGINLANDDGLQVLEDDDSLRSPHNGHMTFLAREGVPGFMIWIALQLAWAGSVIASYRSSKRNGHRLWSNFFLFQLAYWSAFVVNASFDVYLEGPVGGIWFWTVFGVGLGAVYIYKFRVSNNNILNLKC